MSTRRTESGTPLFRSQTKKFIESMDGLQWLALMDENDMDAMLKDIAEILKKHTGAERRTQIAYILWDWKATAEVQADPVLHHRLSEPTATVSGEPVPIPVA